MLIPRVAITKVVLVRRTCIHHTDEQLRVKYSGVSEYVRIRGYVYVHSIELEKTHELKEMIKLGMQVG